MKRKPIIITFAALLILCSVFALTACNKEGNPEKENISRRTDAFFAGESEIFAVSVEKGVKERNFIADGKATDVSDFCQLTITPLAANDFEAIAYVISAEGKTLEGELGASDFGEFSGLIELDFAPTHIKVSAGESVSEIDLANVLDGMLTASDVINIAKQEFKDKLEKELMDGKPEREIYVKLITGDRENYFYYVSFIGEGVDYYAMLVNPKTGEIVSKRQ